MEKKIYETKKFRFSIYGHEREIEITKVVQKGKSFKELEIPKEYELLDIYEAMELINQSEFCDWIDFQNEKNGFYIKQPLNENEGKYCAWVGCSRHFLSFVAIDYFGGRGAFRGAIFKKIK